MTRRGTTALGIVSAVPVTVCSIAAGGMLLAGDDRLVAVTASLPGAVFATGLVLSAVPLGVLLAGRRSARRAERAAAAAQESVENAAAAAARAERENHQRFLARLDHELKNPITAIRATAVAAQDGTQTEAWATIDAQSTKLSTLVRDLRKLAELETRALETESVDLEQLLTESITALTQQNPAAGARIVLTVTRVPWAVPPLVVDVDLVSLVLDNVLGNAAKYSSSGPIEVRLREQDGWAVIEIADAGRGIPAADLPSVFDELARAQNARDVSGSGIGLTLVATVMRRHGGDVSLRSVEGAGSVITLRLPVPR